MAYVIQVNPIDSEVNVALGVDLPFNGKRGATFQQNYLTMDQALANAKNLLLTEPGERVMLPTFGCGLRKTIFENLTEETIEALDLRIRSSFATFLPYIFIKELELTPKEDENKLLVKLSISLDPNSFDVRPILIEVTQ